MATYDIKVTLASLKSSAELGENLNYHVRCDGKDLPFDREELADLCDELIDQHSEEHKVTLRLDDLTKKAVIL